MKRVITGIAMASLLVGGMLFPSSCNKQLELKTEYALDATKPVTKKEIPLLLVALYQRVMQPTSNIPYMVQLGNTLLSDDTELVNAQWFQVAAMKQHLVPADDILLGYFYSGWYNIVSRANLILSVQTEDYAKGEAHYCRAYAYLRLYDYFRSVPIITEKSDPSKPIKPSSPDEVLEFVAEDLRQAVTMCHPFKQTTEQEPSQEAAKALLARVYRLQKKLNLAGTLAEELINSGQFNLAELKESDGRPDLSSEYIFCLHGTQTDSDGGWGYLFYEPEALSWNCLGATKSLFKLLTPTDKRQNYFVASTSKVTYKNETLLQRYCNKYSEKEDADLIVSRISEMYLISAEAGNANRLTEFHKSRNSNLSVKDERRLELSFEFVHWEDQLYDGEQYRLPYPQDAIESNPLLKN